jgi:hypothetical protein
MKDILTFILVSVLIFAIVNGDDDNSLSSKFHNSLKATFPETIYTTPPPVSNNSSNSNNLPELLLIGFENIYINKGILFYVITRIIKYIGYEPNNLTLTAAIEKSSTNLRFLEVLEFNCPLYKTEGNIYTFKCENSDYNASQLVVNLDSVKIDDQNKLDYLNSAKLTSNLAENNEVGDLLLNKEIIVMENCNFADSDKNIVIEGKFEKDISREKLDNPYLLVTDGENKRNVVYTYDKTGEKDRLTLDNKVPINTNLHGQIGRINNDTSFILSFTEGTGNPNYNFTETEIIKRSSSSGLSTGAIVAIVIPCIAVLLAAAALAFILGNRTKPPMQNLDNTVGVNSSSIINNK